MPINADVGPGTGDHASDPIVTLGDGYGEESGSILVGILLGVVAILLIDRNRRFLVGVQVSPPVKAAIVQALRDLPEVSRVTASRVDFVGPRQLYLVADVDLSGDDPEPRLALRLRALEAKIRESPAVVDCTLSLSAPDEPDLWGVSCRWRLEPSPPNRPSMPGTPRTARPRG